MLIKYSRLTLSEIAAFWASEDAAGVNVIETRRLSEILTLLREAWERGELTTSLDIQQRQMADNWFESAKIFAADDPDLGAQQAYIAMSAHHHLIDQSQVERKVFYAWLERCGLRKPNFWHPEKETYERPIGANIKSNMDGPGVAPKHNTGPRPIKANRARAAMAEAMQKGELSLEQLHDAPMKWFAGRFDVSRPTAAKVVNQLRRENPRQNGSD